MPGLEGGASRSNKQVTREKTETLTEEIVSRKSPASQVLLEMVSPQSVALKGLMKVSNIAKKNKNAIEQHRESAGKDPKSHALLEIDVPRKTTSANTLDRTEEVVYRRRKAPASTHKTETVNKTKNLNINIQGLFAKTKKATESNENHQQTSSHVHNYHYTQQPTTCLTCMHQAYYGYYR